MQQVGRVMEVSFMMQGTKSTLFAELKNRHNNILNRPLAAMLEYF